MDNTTSGMQAHGAVTRKTLNNTSRETTENVNYERIRAPSQFVEMLVCRWGKKGDKSEKMDKKGRK